MLLFDASINDSSLPTANKNVKTYAAVAKLEKKKRIVYFYGTGKKVYLLERYVNASVYMRTLFFFLYLFIIFFYRFHDAVNVNDVAASVGTYGTHEIMIL